MIPKMLSKSGLCDRIDCRVICPQLAPVHLMMKRMFTVSLLSCMHSALPAESKHQGGHFRFDGCTKKTRSQETGRGFSPHVWSQQRKTSEIKPLRTTKEMVFLFCTLIYSLTLSLHVTHAAGAATLHSHHLQAASSSILLESEKEKTD